MKSQHKKKSESRRKPERAPSIAAGAGVRPLLVALSVPALVALATFVVFLPVLDNGFVNWDDDKLLLDNPYYRGLGWGQLRWMFTTFHMGHYQPLSWVTLGMDYLLWGMNPFGYHLTGLLLHGANAVLFYFLALRLLSLAYAIPGASGGLTLRIGAGFAALFFAVHPLRVESVAWVTERRDVLSEFFLLCTVLLYLRAVSIRHGGSEWRRWRSATVIVYALSLLSKATGITLPIVLLVLDVYPLGRLGGGRGKWFGREARRVWWEKMPFFLLASAAGVTALLAQREAGALKSVEAYSIATRIAQGLFGLVFYLRKTVLPVGLSALYELPKQVMWWSSPFVLDALMVLGLTIGLLLFRRRWPAGLASWVCYAVILGPVLGIAQSGAQFVADRYSYMSCSGWAVLFGAGVYSCCRGWGEGNARRRISISTVGTAGLVVVVLGSSAWKQALLWHDSETLWRHVLTIEPRSMRAHNNLGMALSNEGKIEEAMEHFRKSLQINPDYVEARYNLATRLAQRGDLEEAIQLYRRSLEIYPDDVATHYNLAGALVLQNRVDEAAAHFEQALRIKPDFAEAHNSLGRVMAAKGDLNSAVDHFRQALRDQPDFAPAHESLAMALAEQGKRDEAIMHHQEALRIMSSRPKAGGQAD